MPDTVENRLIEEREIEKQDEETEDRSIGSVLVVGAGIAGIRAALDLAEVGYRVLLTDSSPAIAACVKASSTTTSR
jgi:heterodisulfide reductase subunit A-like polyferredoxin